MTWFKVDDSFHQHKKVRKLGVDRLPATGLWVLAGTWSADSLSDGFVPFEVVDGWDPPRKYTARLVDVGLWEIVEEDGEEGVHFHDWEGWQPTRDRVLQRRQEEADRKARWREQQRAKVAAESHGQSEAASHGVSQRDTTRDVRGDTTRESQRESGHPDQTRPGPSRPDPKESSETSSSAPPPREDVDALCRHLYDRLVANGSKPKVVDAWRTEARLLIDRDGREVAEAHRLIDWCQDDAFWRSNILGMPKFRKQYDQLRLKAQSETAPLRLVSGGTNRVPTTQARVQAALSLLDPEED